MLSTISGDDWGLEAEPPAYQLTLEPYHADEHSTLQPLFGKLGNVSHLDVIFQQVNYSISVRPLAQLSKI